MEGGVCVRNLYEFISLVHLVRVLGISIFANLGAILAA
jgi:hypothetical protein